MHCPRVLSTARIPSESDVSSIDLMWSNAESGRSSSPSESSKSEDEGIFQCVMDAVDRGECQGSRMDESQVRVREVEGGRHFTQFPFEVFDFTWLARFPQARHLTSIYYRGGLQEEYARGGRTYSDLLGISKSGTSRLAPALLPL